METEKAIVKAGESRLPKFVEDSYESIEKMNAFANMLLESKLLPVHFYEKGPDGKTDYSRGKTASVVAVLLQGYQLQLPPLMATQHIIPVNGLLSIKGDMAKSLIFNSGKLKPGSWVEEETGSIEGGDFAVKITATRADNGTTISRSFSIVQAKRAGLWVTEQQVAGQDGWRYKQSAWYKYPARMIGYRALGFIARDLFPDVMNGIYTTEEALDLPKETAEVIETEAGTKIIIPDRQHAQDRSKKLTERVADKIPADRYLAPGNIQNAEIINPATITSGQLATSDKDESPFKAEKGSVEYFMGVKVCGRDGDGNPLDEAGNIIGKDETPQPQETTKDEWSSEGMDKKDTKDLLAKVNSDTDMIEASEMIGGKNTHKKLKGIILAWQSGTLAEYTAKVMPKEKAPENPPVDPGSKPNLDFDKQRADKEADDFLNAPMKTQEKQSVSIVNKYNLDIPDLDKGEEREFSTTKKLFNLLASIKPPVDNNRYLELGAKMGYIEKYADRELFCKYATIQEINLLLNTN